MRHHPAHDVSRTYRSVSILLGRAALRADQHVHLPFPPRPSITVEIGILVTGKIMAASRRVSSADKRRDAGIPGSPRPHRRCRTSRPDLGERWSSRLVATAAEDRLNISPWPGEIYGCLEFARAKRVEKDPFS